MAKINPDMSRLKAVSDLRKSLAEGRAKNESRPADVEPWDPEDSEPDGGDAHKGKIPGRKEGAMGGPVDGNEVEHLRSENVELRQIVSELRQLLDETTAKDQAAADRGPASGSDERDKEYERLLEEKNEKIRELYLRAQELEEVATSAAAREALPNEQDLLALSDELERERVQLEQDRRQMEEDRRQLQEDEEGMMNQMRHMELQMAKERAELARQRRELQELMINLRHEIEVAQRDALLKERLSKLQRNLQDMAGRRPGEEAPAPPPAPEPPAPKKDSGLLKRLFGSGK